MEHAGKVKIFRGLSVRECYSRIAFLGITIIVLTVCAICLINAIKLIDKPFPGFLSNSRLVVPTTGQYNWTGTQAGLNNPDKILKADNRIISSIDDLKDVVNSTDVGTPITYSIERGEKIIEITIQTMTFKLVDFKR